MKKRIHHKKWNKNLRRRELEMIWHNMAAKAPNLSLDLMEKYERTVSKGW